MVTGQNLWPACLPAYARSSNYSGLLGVTCMDFNVIAKPSGIMSKPYWDHLACKVSDMTKTCRSLDTSECRLEALRKEAGPESTCSSDASSASSATACGCVDPDCRDDDQYIDEKGYFCDTWVGDDCSQAETQWQYSAAGTAEAMQRCRRSCGLCPVLTPCPYTLPNCQAVSRPSQASCRACRTQMVTGIDIEGRPMTCPGDPSTTSSGAPQGCFCASLAGIVSIVSALVFSVDRG